MRKIKIGELKKHIELFDDAHVPLMIYGTFGIGKSDIVKRSAEEKSQKHADRTYLDWMATADDVKLDALKNPGKYFAFIDIRLSQMEPSDIRGIPNIFNSQEIPYLQTIPWSWVMYITRPEACGTLFLDEINLAAPQIAASAYQIINDRVISDRNISPGINIVAAGNTARDTDIVYDMPNPLKDRFAELEISFDSKAWLEEWAAKNCHPMIYSFCTFKESWIHHLSENDTDKHVTPRGIERASKIFNKFMDTSDKFSPFLFDAIAACVGDAWTVQFKAYINIRQKLDFDKILENPESVTNDANYNTDQRYAIIGACTERVFELLNNERQDQQSKAKKIANILKIILYLPSNLFVLAWKQFKAHNTHKDVYKILEDDKSCVNLLLTRHKNVINKII